MNNTNVKQFLNKVPEVTLYFWSIKVLCTTVGETAADYLNETLHFGLIGTSFVMSILLLVMLFFQMRAKKYIPSLYWIVVVLISIVGTLITDNLTDKLEVSLVVTSFAFLFALIATFVGWFASEKTLSVHSITTVKRETFYWSAILFTFALGTAAGDLMAEKLGLGYQTSIFIFAGAIALVTALHFVVKYFLTAEHQQQSTNAVLAFWVSYILTRPLGASIGDFLSQSRVDGGIGLGTTLTSALFLFAIFGLVYRHSISKR
jgi:uncharacterized membrane-anchored protein